MWYCEVLVLLEATYLHCTKVGRVLQSTPSKRYYSIDFFCSKPCITALGDFKQLENKEEKQYVTIRSLKARIRLIVNFGP